MPANPGLAPAPTFAGLTAACQTGVDAEIKDAKLYDTLKLQVDNADARSVQVFANLQAASLNSHLPAFEACNQRTHAFRESAGARHRRLAPAVL